MKANPAEPCTVSSPRPDPSRRFSAPAPRALAYESGVPSLQVMLCGAAAYPGALTRSVMGRTSDRPESGRRPVTGSGRGGRSSWRRRHGGPATSGQFGCRSRPPEGSPPFVLESTIARGRWSVQACRAVSDERQAAVRLAQGRVERRARREFRDELPPGYFVISLHGALSHSITSSW